MTSRQAQLLAFIRAYQEEHGFAPSFDEMATHLEVTSKSGVHRIVTALVDQGKIRRLAGRSRTIEVIEAPSRHMLAAQLAQVSRATFIRVVDEKRAMRPGELEAALLAVLP